MQNRWMPAMGLAVAVSLVVGAPCSVWAADMPWGSKKTEYTAIEPKDLRVFLREFAAQQGVGVFLDPEVKGELTGRYDLSPRSMMELLGRTFGLIWYFDGKVLYVYPASAVESSVIRLNDINQAQFQRTLDRLGISDSRFPLAFDDRGSVLVSGPKRYVELVRDAAKVADRGGDGEQGATETRVFTLRYAFADDHLVTAGGREVRVPGVVSILRQAYGGAAGGGDPRRVGTLQRRSAEPVVNSGPLLPNLRGAGRRDELVEVEAQSADAPRRAAAASPGLPSFAADPRTNSVVVHDLVSRVGQYETLIRRLDERPRLIELEANIVEINADDFAVLGIDWRLTGRRGSAELGGGGIANAVVPPVQGGTLGNVAGAVLSVVAGSRTELFARLAALEQSGKASTSAQPKIMTLNNVEASLEATSTFYVPVQGFQDAQLFEVSSGTSIRITPSVISALEAAADETGATGAARDMVRLLIKIEDGGPGTDRVGQLPVVKRTIINTQSLVTVGSTLLIAGYAQERDSRVQRGVPGLSKLPVLGHLFKSNEKSVTRVERLFMITPRVVDLRAGEAVRLPTNQAASPAPLGSAPGH
jgi:type III secretion protein C